METKSIRKSQPDMNMDNAMAVQRVKPGTLICYRCGKKDRLLKNCPLPYQPTLAFAPKLNHAVKNTLVMEEGSETQEETPNDMVSSVPAEIPEQTNPPDLLTMANIPLREEEEHTKIGSKICG